MNTREKVHFLALHSIIYRPMERERRRVPRIAFAGVAELAAAGPSKHIIAAATNLSRFGCFIKTTAGFPMGCQVSLRVTSEGEEFSSAGEVLYVLPGKGMGIKFGAFSPKDRRVLEGCLSESEPRDFKSISTPEAVRIRMTFLNDFPVQLVCPECRHISWAKISVLKEEKAHMLSCGHTWGTEGFAEDIAVAERELERVIRQMTDPRSLES